MHDLFKKRRSIRHYNGKNISEEVLHQLLCAGMVAPSGCNTKGYEFIVVNDKDTLNKLSEMGKWVDFLKKCDTAIVLISKEYAFWVEDCALVASNIMHEAVNQGLSSCWADIKDGKELDNTDRETFVKNLLNIPDEYRVLCALALGYTDLEIREHSENEYKSEKVHHEKW